MLERLSRQARKREIKRRRQELRAKDDGLVWLGGFAYSPEMVHETFAYRYLSFDDLPLEEKRLQWGV